MRKGFTQAQSASQSERDEEAWGARPLWLGASCSFCLPTSVSPDWGSGVGRLPIPTDEEINLSRQLCVAGLRVGRCWLGLPSSGALGIQDALLCYSASPGVPDHFAFFLPCLGTLCWLWLAFFYWLVMPSREDQEEMHQFCFVHIGPEITCSVVFFFLKQSLIFLPIPVVFLFWDTDG